MDDAKGCFLWAIAIVGWFILWGMCMSIGDASGISPFVILLIIVGVIVVIGGGGYLIYQRAESSREDKMKKKANEIKAQFPLAYQQYLQEINKGKSWLNTLSELEIAEKVLACPIESWRNKEEKLQQEKKERDEIIEKSTSIAIHYPHGILKWKEKHSPYSHEAIIEHEDEIRQYEEYYKIAKEFDDWENEQSEFTKTCRNIGPQLMPTFGYYKYNIPFDGPNDDGGIDKGEYLVWQYFAGSYCLESDLDYTDFEYIKQRTNNIDSFKKRERYYLPSVYESIKDFINKLAETYDVSVYLCANNNDWDAVSLNYHYCQVKGTPFYELPESIEVCDPSVDALTFDEVLDYNEYPEFKNQHVIIIEMQTDNSHLIEVCKNVIERNKNKHPLITYISFLKGYDRDEMLEIIEEKNKEKAEEERKQQEERELMLKQQDVKDNIKGLPSIIESNNIEQIESKIQYINDNIDFATDEEKEKFEQIKVDYKNKKALGIPQKEELLFVNYNIPKIKDEDGSYVIVRMPQKGCIVWPYRRRTIARRGYMESDFENKLKKHLTPKVNVFGDVNILPQDGVRPYEPDIALVYSENGLNVRIDIEIDEPYAAVTNKPTHYIGCGDESRDANLNCLGWIVIRFSERQVFQQTIECVKFVVDLIKSIDNTFDVLELANIQALTPERQWTRIDCQRMAAERFRQQYLDHEFGRTEESLYDIQDLKLTSFETSILEKVKPAKVTCPVYKTTIIEEDCNNDNLLLYNEVNRYEQDAHIRFDAAQHVYTVDGIQYKSVSSVISDLFPEFDTEYWSSIKGQQRGVPPQQVAEEWDVKGQQSREVGTFLHQQIENHFLKKPVDREYHFYYQGDYVHEDCIIDIDWEISFFEEFLNETKINPFRTEWRIFDKSLKLAGTIDLITQNEDGSFSIYDWKRSSRLFQENHFQHGIGKLGLLEDTPRNHYFLQQNLYRYILEHQYGLNIQTMRLVGLHPDYCGYEVIEVPKMDKEISIIIQMM